ncbi:Phenylalanine 4-hydroxylase [Chitinophaga rupis]|uniref:Phenylalanine 4-hydroxylase n=1 Tax=Chitinophaga rupis TaxID=573321 RepID=A0A1H8KDA0_9BACT|nr:phenylalanine 4-monooxygenase [Chitinophaga rupis]SEN90815.1 Phenylalanine 4-hydroxylase [Chitinophaga rupis]
MYPEQNYLLYTEEDHRTWTTLFERQSSTILRIAATEFQKGFKQLSLAPDRVANMEMVNNMLYPATGWKVIPVEGLVPNRDFFTMLINKQFPVTVHMRKPHEIDFAELPDIFHDVYGHVPMLMNSLFCEFMANYSSIAINYAENDDIVNYFGRLYWFTLEMGLIRENDILKPYGGAILTSSGEVKNIDDSRIPKHAFNLQQIISTPYDNLKIQQEYFYIDSFYQLFDSLKDMRRLADSLAVKSHV